MRKKSCKGVTFISIETGGNDGVKRIFPSIMKLLNKRQDENSRKYYLFSLTLDFDSHPGQEVLETVETMSMRVRLLFWTIFKTSESNFVSSPRISKSKSRQIKGVQ